MTVNELIRERRKFLVELQRRWRAMDSKIEAGERLIKRVLSRKNKVPEVLDLKKIETELTGVLNAVGHTNDHIEKGFVV